MFLELNVIPESKRKLFTGIDRRNNFYPTLQIKANISHKSIFLW